MALASRLTTTRSSSAGSASASGSPDEAASLMPRACAPRSARACATISSRLAGTACSDSAPACSLFMSSRLSTSLASWSIDSSAAARSSPDCFAVQVMSVERRLLTAALAAASGARRSWLTVASSAVRILSASAIGPAARGPRRGGQPVLFDRRGGVRREGAEHAAVLGRQRPAAQRETEVAAHRNVHVGVLGPLRCPGGRSPGSAPSAPKTPVPAGRQSDAGPRRVGGGLLDPKMLWRSLPDPLLKLDPRVQFHNPVMFVVEAGSVLTTYSAIKNPSVFAWTITAFLWLTVVFANLAEAVAEGRGKAQAETLRRTKRETVARRLIGWQPGQVTPREEDVAGTALTLGDHVVVEAGQIIPD